MSSARIAVDAANLLRDRRGMGRIARAVLRVTEGDPASEPTLLAPARAARALQAEFPGIAVERPQTARRRGRYDVVWFPFNGMRFPAHAPALVTIHDAFAFTEPHRETIARYREQQPIRRAAREAKRIVTDSQWSRAEIARELGVPFERIDVVLPEPDAFWSPGNGDGLPETLQGRRFALVVGVREARKNVRLVLDACARALRGPGEWLVVVGELAPDDRDYARALGLPCGEISAGDAMLRTLYRGSRVVLVPSLAEGFGLVAVEALACGAAVLASSAAALPEATAGAAPLLDPHDVNSWARAVRAVFEDDAWAAELRTRALARFVSRDRDGAARRMLRLLHEAAGRA